MNTKEYISSGIIESYILGHASPEEAGILECVMKNNAEVREAFEEAQKTLEDLATAQSVIPPIDLKSKIWNKIQQEQIVEEVKPAVSADIPSAKPQEEIRIQGNNNWKTFAIAASVLFLVSVGGNMFWMSNQSKMKTEIADMHNRKKSQDLEMQKMNRKMDMATDPNMEMVMLKGVEKHADSKAMVFWNKKTKDVYLTVESLPKAPDGMQYQLWAIEDGKPVNAGMYTHEKDSEIALANISNAQAFAITLEKQGGSTIPTMENMYVMGEI
ncbi:anti-sigma factor [Chryseobacterium sp.]|uniref:anti-sigma factor n=1 Tax=Chryseobacterium sp. TaxID=1871047 RepID=UPI00289E59FF|nr:anti-sigma factor [Chryseobacterium sp.]